MAAFSQGRRHLDFTHAPSLSSFGSRGFPHPAATLLSTLLPILFEVAFIVASATSSG
jgi:hypothetical protein